ncbi:MAG TPA: peptide ABC transporter substrate-binding protein [Fibrobacteria bacterium]|nr:peptide ABC transporter substrate-binding protein [Fibrobacteria bacterium]
MPFSARAILVFLILLQGCRKGAGDGPKPLVIANSADPASLDPHAVTGQPELRVVGALFEGLVIRGLTDPKVRPGAAHSWDVSADARTYTFHLRPGKWSDGSALTSRDFLRSWRRFVDPLTASEYSSLLKIIRNGNAIREKTLPPDSLGVSAPDDSTFVVQLEYPVAYFLDLCAFEPFAPVPLDTIAKYHEKWTQPGHLVGNGAYFLKTWKHNVEIELVKNPRYWDSANVLQARVIIKPVEDQMTAFNMFMSREVDWIFNIPPGKLELAKKMPEYFSRPMFGTYYYIVNCKNPGYDSRDLRKALSYAIDREQIVKRVMKDIPTPAHGFVPPTPSYPGVSMELFNPVKAREFLAKSGFGPGKQPPELQILFNTAEVHRDIAQVVRQMWKETLGLDAELVNYEWKVYLENTKNLNYRSIARASWIGDVPDPISFLELYTSDNGNNRTGYRNPDYDKVIQASFTLADPAGRLAKLKEAEAILMDDMPVIPVYYYALTELRNPKLQNAIPNPLGMYTWKEIHLAP